MADLTVMTWNIQNLFPAGHGGGPATQQEYDDKVGAPAAVIDAVEPDILALQEDGPEQVLADLNGACSIDFDNRLSGVPDIAVTARSICTSAGWSRSLPLLGRATRRPISHPSQATVATAPRRPRRNSDGPRGQGTWPSNSLSAPRLVSQSNGLKPSMAEPSRFQMSMSMSFGTGSGVEIGPVVARPAPYAGSEVAHGADDLGRVEGQVGGGGAESLGEQGDAERPHRGRPAHRQSFVEHRRRQPAVERQPATPQVARADDGVVVVDDDGGRHEIERPVAARRRVEHADPARTRQLQRGDRLLGQGVADPAELGRPTGRRAPRQAQHHVQGRPGRRAGRRASAPG